jgi:hypothetical protein
VREVIWKAGGFRVAKMVMLSYSCSMPGEPI